ncbi:hypothetical protein B0H12DRAFT_1217556 [Mycena haematopus]|nr:hypothetical protein B0H12DRAFT_1217556 [Mycena haematopus]
MRTLSLNEELYRPKRVVIETTCSGESSWRFVPKARWEEGVLDEGSWPRVIDLCGQLVECSQDQWDIYKLDRTAYDCLVRAPPELTVISLAVPKPMEAKQPLGKHRMSSAEPCPDMPPSKTFHPDLDEDSEEDEVADMVVDGALPNVRRMSSAPGDRVKKFREEIEKNRKERREKATARSERLATREDVFFDFSAHQRTSSPTLDAGPKRKVATLFDSLPLRAQDDPEYRSPEEEFSRNTLNYSPTKTSKRTRTFSPGAAKRDLECRRLEREKKKREKREKELDHRKQQRFQHFLHQIYSEVSNAAGPSNQQDPTDVLNDPDGEDEDKPVEVDAEAERQAFIAEARRKLAELEADRPLWDAEAAKRKKLEKEEQEAQRSRMAERLAVEARKAEEERRARMEKERQQQTQAKEEARATGDERARRERERRQRNERWAYGPWTTQRALERYKILSDIFDSTKFSPDDPIAFDVVPWPILPVKYSVEDIDWSTVEGFFNAVKPHMRSQDFASFVEKSHRRFHPDRWRSRGLLKSVADETERGCLEVVHTAVFDHEAPQPPSSPILASLCASELGAGCCMKSGHLEASANPGVMADARDLRRVRSAGGIPVSSSVRVPEPALFQPSRRSESAVQSLDPNLPLHDASSTADTIAVPPAIPRAPHSASLVIGRPRSPTPPIHEDASTALPVPLPLPLPPPPPPPAPLVTHNVSSYSQIMTFFGYGRGASRERKLLVSLWYNLAWGFVQVVLIITMLAIAAHTESKTTPGVNEWDACDRPLGAWACIYVFRVVFSSSLTYWGWLRDRKVHANAEDSENATDSSPRSAAATTNTARLHSSSGPSAGSRSSTIVNTPEAPALPHSILYSRLSILSSLITLSWFLTAHILEYTSMHSCRFSSPHVWWLTFGILCIMYLVVLEVVILGFVVFVVAPIIFLFWNIFLMCLGRHPMQNPGMIRPDVGKLSPSIVDRIPLVMYIPPPPDALPGSITIPQAVYSNSEYPPKAGPSTAKPKRFKFLHRRKGNKAESSSSSAGDVPVRAPQQAGEPQTWQDHWEHTGYPFVVLEGNRAACAVCLMDFEEPKRIAGLEPVPTTAAPPEEPAPSPPAIQEVPVEINDPAATTENQLKLEDAGEGAVPLRLLACGHVFHKTCLDPWLTDVSGRCPVCQRAVELPAKRSKKERRP